MGQTKAQKIVKQLGGSVQKKTAIATDMFIPNHSGISVHPEFEKYLSDYIPYLGATSDVDLGTHDLTTTGNIGITSASGNMLLEVEDIGGGSIQQWIKFDGVDAFINYENILGGKAITLYASGSDTGVALDVTGATWKPVTNEGLSLGTSLQKWKDLHLGGTIDLGTNTIVDADIPKWNTAYDHSQDNSQAHSDYARNVGDSLSGTYSGTFSINTSGDIDCDDIDADDVEVDQLDVNNWAEFNEDVDISGDLDVTGCITGDIDPDHIQYNYYSRENLINDCKRDIPVGVKCVVTFVNEKTELIEVYYPHLGKFKDIIGNVLHSVPVQVNPLVKVRYSINPYTGEWKTKLKGVKPRYKVKKGVIADSKLGVFQDKETRLHILTKEDAIVRLDDRL